MVGVLALGQQVNPDILASELKQILLETNKNGVINPKKFINAVKETLNTLEAGWGGSPTFIGSKQGESCNIGLSEIKKTVFANLTPEYKEKVTSTAGKSNIGKGIAE